jgi:hypothetical protein
LFIVKHLLKIIKYNFAVLPGTNKKAKGNLSQKAGGKAGVFQMQSQKYSEKLPLFAFIGLFCYSFEGI